MFGNSCKIVGGLNIDNANMPILYVLSTIPSSITIQLRNWHYKVKSIFFSITTKLNIHVLFIKYHLYNDTLLKWEKYIVICNISNNIFTKIGKRFN